MYMEKRTETYRVMEKLLLLFPCTIVLLFFWVGYTWAGLANNKMDYHDYEKTIAVLQDLSDSHPELVKLKVIGKSDNFPGQGQTRSYDIYAMRVGPVGDQEFRDGGDVIPSILFVGGIHGREWLASESVFELARHLVKRALDPGTPEYALLRRVAVWLIPIANPSGRVIDDGNSGDPDSYYVGSGNTEYGWRHSGDRRGCESASDINRNFSTGWGTASDAGCGWDKHFEGLAPFSNREAVTLKKFVQNHWISMVVDVHTCTQLIWNTWGTGDRAGVKMKQRAVERWDRGLYNLAEAIYDSPGRGSSRWHWFVWLFNWLNFVNEFTLEKNDPTGTGGGQFTAWLQQDHHIPAFIIELPPNNLRSDTDYYTSELRYDTTDGSNSFHPSSSRVKDLIRFSFIPMAEYLIGQANAPGSATSVGFVFDGDTAHAVDLDEPRGSFQKDFGILAAKIGSGDPGAPGEIVVVPADLRYGDGKWRAPIPAFDWLYHDDNYELYFWVQRYGSAKSPFTCHVSLQLRSRPYGSDDTVSWRVDASDWRRYRLGKREKVFDSFPFEIEENRDYELTVRASPLIHSDQFSRNDLKVFRFTTHGYGTHQSTD